MDAVVKEMVNLFEKDIVVQQVKSIDVEGNLKCVYPSRTDLLFSYDSVIKVVRE